VCLTLQHELRVLYTAPKSTVTGQFY